MRERNCLSIERSRLFRGFTVAIVGADGSGKSTIANMIVDALPRTAKYAYMGASIEASNVSLPTSRFLVYLKRRRIARHIDDNRPLPPSDVMSDEIKESIPSGRIVKTLGLINRMAEEWYRQLYVWSFTVRGLVVVCDRHFLYEYCPDSEALVPADNRLSARIHRTMLSRFFPRPALTIFLDAPPDVLYSRKPEWTLEHLTRQRTGIVEQSKSSRNFVHIDSTRSIEDVFSDAMALIEGIQLRRRE